MKKRIVFVYALVHFIVDLACAILVNRLVSPNIDNSLILFTTVLIYNFFAFAMQLPIGIIADKVNRNAICSATGCLLVAFAYLFSQNGIIACLVAGIGNAMFHVGGGIDVLNISDKKASLSGIFVSTGAMGIFLGSTPKFTEFNQYYILVISVIISAILLFYLYQKIKDEVKNAELIIPELDKSEKLIVVCLMITVVIRSYMGLIIAFDWKSDLFLAFISILAVVFGKMFGGIIGDKIGFSKISIISLVISSILFIFAFDNCFLGVLAILFFNMTMPITLTALSNILFYNKGMAFGLLTFALFLGALPVFFGYGNILFTQSGLFLITIISAIILYIGMRKYNKIMENKNDF